MTINKSQGANFKKRLGLWLLKPVFAHGQLYVQLSRGSSFEAVQVVVDDVPEMQGMPLDKTFVFTLNIVDRALLQMPRQSRNPMENHSAPSALVLDSPLPTHSSANNVAAAEQEDYATHATSSTSVPATLQLTLEATSTPATTINALDATCAIEQQQQQGDNQQQHLQQHERQTPSSANAASPTNTHTAATMYTVLQQVGYIVSSAPALVTWCPPSHPIAPKPYNIHETCLANQDLVQQYTL